MPARSKNRPSAKADKVAEDKMLTKQAEVAVNSDDASVSSNGTRVRIPYMKKFDGSYFVMETERRSRKSQVIKWRQLNGETK